MPIGRWGRTDVILRNEGMNSNFRQYDYMSSTIAEDARVNLGPKLIEMANPGMVGVDDDRLFRYTTER